MPRAIRITSASGALTVNLTGPSGTAPTVYTDSAFTATATLPATVTSGATSTFWLQSPGAYALSVKTATGTEIAADNNQPRTVDIETDGTIAALTYDTRFTHRIEGDSGRGSDTADTSAAYAPVAFGTQAVAQADLARVVRAFSPLTGDLGIGLRSNGTDYELLYGFGSARYWRAILKQESTNPGSFALNQLQEHGEAVPMLSKADSDASVVFAGTWTRNTVQAAAYGGIYDFSTSAAATVTFTVPSSNRIGVRIPQITNGGLGRVSIDGDFTKANLLPTAQQVVNSGAYPNTILVANGGPCAPTDRVLDTYGPVNNFNVPLAIADETSLTTGTHTVVLTPVAVARTVGAGTRLYVSGYSYSTSTTTLPTDAGASMHVSASLAHWSLNSAHEYALQATFPIAGSTLFGSVHGYEVQDSLTVTVDGTAQTLTAGQILAAASNVEITRTTHLVSPDDSSTIANVVTVYHLDRNGLRVTPTITWAASLSITAAYSMFPLNGVAWGANGKMSQADVLFNQGSLLNAAQGPYTFAGTGDVFFGKVKAAAAWVYGGNYGALLWLPKIDDLVNGWAHSTPSYVSIEDRVAAGLNVTKMYFGRIWNANSSPEAVTPGTVWSWSAQYLVGRFPAGAAASLAG